MTKLAHQLSTESASKTTFFVFPRLVTFWLYWRQLDCCCFEFFMMCISVLGTTSRKAYLVLLCNPLLAMLVPLRCSIATVGVSTNRPLFFLKLKNC
jgi:hypothetical protein